MLSDTMKTVQEAEEKADELLSQAQVQAETIVDQAKQDAVQRQKEGISAARQAVDQHRKEAEADGDAEMQKARMEMEKEIAAFREIVKNKEGSAVELVISRLTAE